MLEGIDIRPELALLVGALPVAVWVARSDLAEMRIPNRAVIALLAVFAVIGLVALPLPEYLARWAGFAVVLAATFVLSVIGAMGAGDAKFLAAMAPFVPREDAGLILGLLAVILLVTFALHRLARAIRPIRAATPGWKSWQAKGHFPMGIALSSALVAYLMLRAFGPA